MLQVEKMPPKGKTGASTCTALAIPSLFVPKTGKGSGDHWRGNQHTANKKNEEVTPHALRKRIYGKLDHAIKGAPPAVQEKWGEILKLKGKRGGGIFKHKREFLMKWVGDPSWQEPQEAAPPQEAAAPQSLEEPQEAAPPVCDEC